MIRHRRLAALALLSLVGVACGPDPNDALGAVASSVAAGAAAASSGSCTPVQGYTAPINDKALAVANADTVTVNAADFSFQPTCIRPKAGSSVTLKVTNTGAILHNVTIADQNIDVDIPVGQTVSVVVTTGAAPVIYVCKFHRTAGMVGAVLPAAG